MAFGTCKRLITVKKERLTGDDWTAFVEDMTNKLDVFLLNDRITEIQYNELVGMMKES